MILIEEITFKGLSSLQSKINAIVAGGYEFVQVLRIDNWGHDKMEDSAVIIFKSI